MDDKQLLLKFIRKNKEFAINKANSKGRSRDLRSLAEFWSGLTFIIYNIEKSDFPEKEQMLDNLYRVHDTIIHNADLLAAIALDEIKYKDNPTAGRLLLGAIAHQLEKNNLHEDCKEYLINALKEIAFGDSADTVFGLKLQRGKKKRDFSITGNTRFRDKMIAEYVNYLCKEEGMQPTQNRAVEEPRSACRMVSEHFGIEESYIERTYRKYFPS